MLNALAFQFVIYSPTCKNDVFFSNSGYFPLKYSTASHFASK